MLLASAHLDFLPVEGLGDQPAHQPEPLRGAHCPKPGAQSHRVGERGLIERPRSGRAHPEGRHRDVDEGSPASRSPAAGRLDAPGAASALGAEPSVEPALTSRARATMRLARLNHKCMTRGRMGISEASEHPTLPG